MKRPLPRFPMILADEVCSALHIAKKLDPDLIRELLARSRRNRLRCIAAWGLNPGSSPVDGLEPIPLEHLDTVNRIDEAFAKLHKYHRDGAVEYLSTAVESELAKLRAKSPRKKKDDYGNDFSTAERHQRIVDIAQKADYKSSTDKYAIIERIAELCSSNGEPISHGQIRRILKEAGLTREKKSKSSNSHSR